MFSNLDQTSLDKAIQMKARNNRVSSNVPNYGSSIKSRDTFKVDNSNKSRFGW